MKIEYCFDLISPYTALSLHFLLSYKKLWGIDLVLKPILLTSVMVLSKNRPPGLVPNKSKYMVGDLTHLPKLFDTKMILPPSNFFDAASKVDLFQKIIIAAQVLGLEEKMLFKLIIGFTQAIYLHTQNRTDKDELNIDENLALKVLNNISNLDQATKSKLLEVASQEDVAEMLESNCKDVVKRGGFGSPTMFVSDSKQDVAEFMVFGSDRFELIAHKCNKPYYGAGLQLRGKV